MSGKTGGMPYEVHPSPMKGKDGKNIVYVRPHSTGKMSMKFMDDFCSKNYGLRYGELTRAFEAFVKAAAEVMTMGYRIETPIGSFVPKLSLKREITDPKDVKNRDVQVDGVEYNPGKLWKESFRQWLTDGFNKVDNPNVQELMANPNHLDEALRKSLARGYTTVTDFAFHAQLTKYSARKQLEAWTKGDNPRLIRTRMGQQYIYTEC